MRVFVTGATGHIGSAVVSELLEAGHQVVGLARSDRSAAALTAAGAEAYRGSLDDPDGLREAAAAADGVIHLAFKHDFSDYQGAVASDLRAVEAMGAGLAGSGKPFVVTSGTLMLAFALPPGQLGTEADVAAPPVPRVEAENAAIALAESGVRSSVVRLPPSVHSSLDRHGFVPRLVATAREKGVSAYVGDGANRWPAVHTLDAARLFRLALEKAPAGTRLHGVADEGVPFRDIAEAIGRHVGVPVASVAREEADAHFGFLGVMAALDNPTSGDRTRELLQWRPERADLLADIEAGHYFDTADRAS
ncbi:NAD-dependent epimerase/dehydratase family protein [Streptomyces sp. SID5998]|nr:NAD-dependent epimerase/dehydratase family protein [Streptomyces sp. SID5998]